VSSSQKSSRFLRWIATKKLEYPTFHHYVVFGKIPVTERYIPMLREKIESMLNTELKKEFESAWIEYRKLPSTGKQQKIIRRGMITV